MAIQMVAVRLATKSQKQKNKHPFRKRTGIKSKSLVRETRK